MNINDINFIDYGKSKKGTIVLLHGWGQNIEMMDMLGRPFANDYRVIVIDFPGFGKSPEPNEPWSAKDYAACLFEFLQNKKINNPILVGHSFGGRVSIAYAAKHEVKKIVLLAAPFRPSNVKPNLKVRLYKKIKKLKILNPLANYLKNKWGSEDYKNASEITRGSLVKIVNEDLTTEARKIKCPTIIIFGDQDEAVPYSEGKALSEIIPDAGFILYPGCTHYAYLENKNQTLAIMNNFFNN